MSTHSNPDTMLPEATPESGPPPTMRALVQHGYDTPGLLEVSTVETPRPDDDQVLVHVAATSINIGDWFVVAGAPLALRLAYGLRRPRTRIRGMDLAGTVVRVGANVTNLRAGDRVFGVAEATLADYAVADPAALAPLPSGVDELRAAAIPVAGLTALQAMRDAGRVESGQSVLINGASGGVGTFAVQIARSMGAHVSGVCSGRNVDLVASLGATDVIDYEQEDFTRLGRRWDVVVDNVGNHPLSALFGVLTETGTLVPNSGHGGRVLGPLPRMAASQLRALVSRRAARLFVQSTSTADLQVLADMATTGDLAPVVSRTFTLDEAPAAVAHVGTGHARGKVVVTT